MKTCLAPAPLRSRITACLSLLAATALLPLSAFGQGFLFCPHPLPRPWFPPPHPRPRPPVQYQVDELAIRARIENQVARVEVEQTFENRGHRVLEASFVFPIPYDGAVDQMTLLVDGQELPGKLLPAEEAARIFQQHVQKYRDPALLQWLGHGVYRTRVFPIPPGEKRTVSLRYTQVLRTEFGLTELLIPLRPAQFTSQPINSIKLTVNIRSPQPIKNVYSPTHDIQVERKKGKTAVVRLEAQHAIPTDDFRLLYDVGKKPISTQVITYRPDPNQPGYFLMLISPDLPSKRKTPQPKTVVFVLDRSGSMAGEKIQQAREALKFVLRNLHKGDLFNVIAYDSDVEVFQPELQRFEPERLQEALAFVEGIDAGGSTNLNEALLQAMQMVPQDKKRPTYIVFLTDGRPTAGVTREGKIVDAVRKANRFGARLYTFGLGYDVNSRLLDKLSRTNRGYTVYVRPDEDIEAAVAKLYRRIEAPALVDVQLDIHIGDEKGPRSADVFRVYPRTLTDLFAGDQLVVVGRYRRPGKGTITLKGTLMGEPHSFEFSGKFVKKSRNDRHAFVERLWAVRRVGDIIDEIDLNGENKELVDELVRLAKRHGILTPYTAFLADENVKWSDIRGLNRRTAQNLGVLKENASGQLGFLHRQSKNMMQTADRAGFGGGFGGGGFAAPAASASGILAGRPQPPGSQAAQQAGLGGEVPESSQQLRVQNIGRWALFFRNGKWVDSTLKEEELEKAKAVPKLGPEALTLIRQNGSALAQAIALDGPVVLRVGNQVLEFDGGQNEPEAKDGSTQRSPKKKPDSERDGKDSRKKGS